MLLDYYVSRFPSNGSLYLAYTSSSGGKKKNSYQQWPIFALVYFHMLMCTSYPNYFLKFFPPNYIPHMENALY